MSELHFDELNDKVIKFMHDAGITPVKHAYSFNAAINRLVAVVQADERERFAELVRQDERTFIGHTIDVTDIVLRAKDEEREACAVLVEGGNHVHPKAPDAVWAKTVAKLIRARGQT